MLANLSALYHTPITIVNRLDAKSVGAKADTYYATTLDGCMWHATEGATAVGTGTLDSTTAFKVQVPHSAGEYVPYSEWAKAPANGFTVSVGDWIVLGTVSVPEGATASEVRTLVRAFEPNAFQVQEFRDTRIEGMGYSADGIMRFADSIYITG